MRSHVSQAGLELTVNENCLELLSLLPLFPKDGDHKPVASRLKYKGLSPTDLHLQPESGLFNMQLWHEAPLHEVFQGSALKVMLVKLHSGSFHIP